MENLRGKNIATAGPFTVGITYNGCLRQQLCVGGQNTLEIYGSKVNFIDPISS